MYLFGHIGIGQTLAAPWRRNLPRRALVLGTILPDLIDKPLYYGCALVTGRHGAEIGLISGTRTFGHTGLFLLLLAAVAVFRKSRLFAALTLGVATHLLLDSLGNPLAPASHLLQGGAIPLFWPIHGLAFPVFPYSGAREQLSQILVRPYFLVTELLGLALILWDRWITSHQPEIVRSLRLRNRQMRQEACQGRPRKRGFGRRRSPPFPPTP